MSFLLNGAGEEILFSGDIILGTPSSIVDNLTYYMDTLSSLINIEPAIEWICLPHSIHPTDKEALMVPAKEKLSSYLKYRQDALVKLLNSFG